MMAAGRQRTSLVCVAGGVVSGELATGKWVYLISRPGDAKSFPIRRKPPASTGESIPWGCLYDPMSSSRRAQGTHVMVATLKRPPPCGAASTCFVEGGLFRVGSV